MKVRQKNQGRDQPDYETEQCVFDRPETKTITAAVLARRVREVYLPRIVQGPCNGVEIAYLVGWVIAILRKILDFGCIAVRKVDIVPELKG